MLVFKMKSVANDMGWRERAQIYLNSRIFRFYEKNFKFQQDSQLILLGKYWLKLKYNHLISFILALGNNPKK